jgi:hypothetical protein
MGFPRQYAYEVDLRSGLAQLHLVAPSCRLSFRVIDWPVEDDTITLLRHDSCQFRRGRMRI